MVEGADATPAAAKGSSPGGGSPPAAAYLLRDAVLILAAVWYGWNHFGDGEMGRNPFWGIDLRSFWCGAVAVYEHGRPPYDREYLQTFFPSGEKNDFVFPFLYPPPALLLFRPLSWLPFPQACLAVGAVNELCAFFLMWFIPARLLGASWRREPLVYAATTAFLCVSHPLLQTILHGQVNLLVATLLLVAWDFLRRDRSWPTAVCLALATMLKVFPVLAIPFLFAAGKRKVCLQTVCLLAASAVVSWIALPAGTWEGWWTHAVPLKPFESPLGTFSANVPNNESLHGWCLWYLVKGPRNGETLVDSPFLARAATGLLCGLCLGAGLWAVRRRATQSPQHAIDWAMTIFSLTMFLVSPISWAHHLVTAYGAILVLFYAVAVGGAGNRLERVVVVAATLHLATFLVTWRAFPAVAALWAIAVHLAFVDPRPSIVPPPLPEPPLDLPNEAAETVPPAASRA